MALSEDSYNLEKRRRRTRSPHQPRRSDDGYHNKIRVTRGRDVSGDYENEERYFQQDDVKLPDCAKRDYKRTKRSDAFVSKKRRARHNNGGGPRLGDRSPNPNGDNVDPLSRGKVTRYKKGRDFKPSQFGNVRIGKDMRTDEFVVIKECLRHCIRDREDVYGCHTLENVNKEIEIHRKISNDEDGCPFILKLLDDVQDEKYVYLILEFASGGELGDYINARNQEIKNALARTRGRPRCLESWWEESRKFMKQLLIAVNYLHDRNICHRDLSVENIVLDENFNVKVIDFGLATHCKEYGHLSPVGKMKYMSYECYDERQKYNGKDNDMWCLGIVLYYMLFVKHPWRIPASNDTRFESIFGIQGGTGKYLKKKKLLRRAPRPALDLFDKIFIAQKSRITVRKAQQHPYITNVDEYEQYFEDIAPDLPDGKLQLQISNLRYKEELQEPPRIWKRLDFKTREEIHEFLHWSDRNDRRTTVFDQRGVDELSWRFRIEKPQIRSILTYFYAASRDRADLENRLPTPRYTSRRSPREDRYPRSPLDSSTPQGRNGAPRIDLPVAAFEEKYDDSNFDDGRSHSEGTITPDGRETGTRGSRQIVTTGSPSVNIISPFASPSLQRVTTVGSLE